MYLRPYQRIVRALGVLLYLLVLGVVWEGDLKDGASSWLWLFYGVFVFLFCGAQAFLWLYEAVTGFDGAESVYLKNASRAFRGTTRLLQEGSSNIQPNFNSLTRLFACSVSVSEKWLSRIYAILAGTWTGSDSPSAIRFTDSRG